MTSYRQGDLVSLTGRVQNTEGGFLMLALDGAIEGSPPAMLSEDSVSLLKASIHLGDEIQGGFRVHSLIPHTPLVLLQLIEGDPNDPNSFSTAVRESLTLVRPTGDTASSPYVAAAFTPAPAAFSPITPVATVPIAPAETVASAAAVSVDAAEVAEVAEVAVASPGPVVESVSPSTQETLAEPIAPTPQEPAATTFTAQDPVELLTPVEGSSQDGQATDLVSEPMSTGNEFQLTPPVFPAAPEEVQSSAGEEAVTSTPTAPVGESLGSIAALGRVREEESPLKMADEAGDVLVLTEALEENKKD